MQFPLLSDIVIILGLAVVIILFFQRMKLPAILGFLLTGMIAGPHGLNLVKNVHEVELMAEIGVIFLLFVIGIEFSLKGLRAIGRTVFIGGLLQVGGTIALVALVTYSLGIPLRTAVFMGFLLSMSSTAIVLKMLQEKGDLTAPYGRVSVAILIFQDIIVVLMMLLTPLLAGQMENPGRSLLILSAKMGGIVVAVVLLARYVVPVLLGMVVRTKSRELFILTIVVICFATAFLTSSVGLSLALGAFFAGLIISESEYSHQANANILPFREIFISFFFVSVGMLLDMGFFVSNIVTVHLAAFGVIALKFLIILITVYLLRYPPRTILLSALALFQVGEFAFVLSATGMRYDLLPQDLYQYFLSISIISMGLTPFVIHYSTGIVSLLQRFPMPAGLRDKLAAMAGGGVKASPDEVEEYRDHLVIIGYGVNGENVAKAAKKAAIQYVVVDLDPESVNRAREQKVPVVFGDATDEEILRHIQIQRARVVVIAISHPEATRAMVRAIRMFTETAYVIVRTRYVREVEDIVKMGADEVIPEEFETSIEIFTRVMKQYLVPNDEILGFVNDIRSHNYEILRIVPSSDEAAGKPVHISDMSIVTLPVQQGNNRIVGRTIGEACIRSEFGVTVLAIKRDDKYLMEVNTDTTIEQDDVLYLFGRPDDILRLNKFCELG